MFDITSQRAADTTAIHLKGLDGELLYEDDKREKPIRIHVYGPGSKQFQAIESRQTNRAVKRMEDNDGKVSVPPAEQRRAEQAEDLAAVTIQFENFDYPAPKGESFATNAEMYEAFYADPQLGHLHRQVAKGVGDWGNYKNASKKG